MSSQHVGLGKLIHLQNFKTGHELTIIFLLVGALGGWYGELMELSWNVQLLQARYT